MADTDTQRQAVTEAVRLVNAGQSSNKASDTIAARYGVTGRTVQTWAKKHGQPLGDLSSYVVPQKAIDTYKVRCEAARTELRAILIEKALQGATAADPEDPRGFQQLSIGVGVFLDKYRLEMGEATNRAENVTIDQAVSRMDEEIADMLSQLPDADSR